MAASGPNPRVRRGDARPSAPIAFFTGALTSGAQPGFPIGRAVNTLGVEIKTGKTVAFNVQGSLMGNVWVTLSTTTSSTAGRLVKINWSTMTIPPLSRFRTVIKTITGAGTTGASAWVSV